MGRPVSRSVNRELAQGLTDGSYKQIVKDRGGIVESSTWEARKNLSRAIYGITEKPEKELGDAVGPVRVPYTVDAPTPGIQVSDQK